MNEQLKEFFKYPNAKIAMRDGDKPWRIKELNIELFQYLEERLGKDYKVSKFECKLVLKEVDSISDEDLNELNLLENTWSKAGLEVFNRYCDVSETDLLRSKSYAIGTDKEFYITQEELNQ